MLWLAAYLTGFPPVGLHALRLMHGLAPMWSGLYIISTDEFEEQMEKIKCVSMPSRAYTSFLHAIGLDSNSGILTVSMPSRAYTSFLQLSCEEDTGISVPVSMPSRAYTSFLLNKVMHAKRASLGVNALSGLYLISTVPLQKPRFYAVYRACFCRYLSEYSDNSHFSCMLTFWTYLMRCTYP